MLRKAFCPLLLICCILVEFRASAVDSALIDALVHKGVLSQKDADSLQTQISNEAAQATAKMIPNSRLMTIKGGSHLVLATHIAEIRAAIDEFVGEILKS